MDSKILWFRLNGREAYGRRDRFWLRLIIILKSSNLFLGWNQIWLLSLYLNILTNLRPLIYCKSQVINQDLIFVDKRRYWLDNLDTKPVYRHFHLWLCFPKYFLFMALRTKLLSSCSGWTESQERYARVEIKLEAYRKRGKKTKNRHVKISYKIRAYLRCACMVGCIKVSEQE